MSAQIPACGCSHAGRRPASRPLVHTGSSVSALVRPSVLQPASSAGTCNSGAVPQRGALQVVHSRRGSLPKEARAPDGYVDYETMLLLRPDLNDDERDVELAKFEAFLTSQKAKEISAMVRGVTQLAYPIKGFWEGIYVLYTYTARRSTSVAVQTLLATPPVGEERRVLRFATFCM
ncbi:hypothetical protein WJX73_009192 [Symbiochloris irregularis]|uniref:Plastid ribosomal protein S6 n=1 Tax=Symbiochloris irregularis TaxID=706552 RepID=A0AAW1PQX5_9CHLO